MCNFYDYVSYRFPIITPSEAQHDLEHDRLIKLEEENGIAIRQKNKVIVKQIEREKELVDLLKDIRGLLVWNVLIHNKEGISEPFDSVDNIIKEINEVLKD